MPVPGPLPIVGRAQEIKLNDWDLRVLPGQYAVEEAPRFGEKISSGSLKYGDFQAYESAHAMSSFIGGYGLRRYSDVEDAEAVSNVYSEAEDVDCREGPAYLAGLQVTDTLPGSTSGVLWLGEVTPDSGALANTAVLVAVNARQVFYRTSGGAWTLGLTTATNIKRAAIGVHNGKLMLGYGDAAVAHYTDDLATLKNVTNATPVNLYVHAFTADQAAAYVAGDPNPNRQHKVVSGEDGGTGYATTEVKCGAKDHPIKSLAPGGGVALAFVGKENELGMIDKSSVYRTLVPFDSSLNKNTSWLRWWLGQGGEQQRGPVSVLFPRDRSWWVYQPDSATAGRVTNLAPWGQIGFRPPTVRGDPRAFQGTAQWGYVSLIDEDGNAWIVAQEATTGNVHGALFSLGVTDCRAITVTDLFNNKPRLYFAKGNHLAYVIQPLDGTSPLDDDDYSFAAEGTLTIPDMDLGFPDEQKIVFSLNVIVENINAGAQQIDVEYSLDGGAWTALGTVTTEPAEPLPFPVNTDARRMGLRFTLTTTDPAQTPILLGFSLRMSLNALLYRLWDIKCAIPGGSTEQGTDDLQNPYTVLKSLWAARKAGFPVNFTDRWGDEWTVRILKMREAEVIQEEGKPPESMISLTLLEHREGSGNSAYGDSSLSYGASTARYA